MTSGLCTVVIGLLYLAFDEFVLADFRHTGAITRGVAGKVLTGFQVGLTILSMIVTRSSAMSIQAKIGLPLGNQVVGWIVLSM